MIMRVSITAIALFFAVYAFWDGVLGGGHLLNPFGILFLFLSGTVWLGWERIREIFGSTRDDSAIDNIVKSIGKDAPRSRQSSSSS